MLKGNTVTDMSKDDMKSKILSSLTDLFNAMDSGHKPEVVSDISIHISTILKIISDEYGNIKDNDVDFDIDPPENKIVNEG
jgi:hypothetical protein